MTGAIELVMMYLENVRYCALLIVGLAAMKYTWIVTRIVLTLGPRLVSTSTLADQKLYLRRRKN